VPHSGRDRAITQVSVLRITARKWVDTRSLTIKIKGVAATGGRLSPSVARSLSALEATELADNARGLPEGWIVMVTPPHGQLAMLPRPYAHAFHRCHVGDRQLARIYRADGVDGIRVPHV
jgi:hypothetical protein